MMECIALEKGLYLKPYKDGLGLQIDSEVEKRQKSKEKKTEIKLSHRAFTDFDLVKYAKSMKKPHFRGVFMRNALSIIGPSKFESAIVNLDNEDGPGTHWVAYKKVDNNVEYFDSFANLRLPLDLVKYLSVNRINYNHYRYKNYNTFVFVLY